MYHAQCDGQLKGVSSHNNYGQVCSNLVMEDITTLYSADAMPQGGQQASDIGKKHTTNTDPLMMMCKEGEGSNITNQFNHKQEYHHCH